LPGRVKAFRKNCREGALFLFKNVEKIFLKYILDGSAYSRTQQNEASTRKRSFGGRKSRPSAAHPK
jgi:hypothetical protein